LKTLGGQKTKKHLVAHRDYPSITNYWTEVPTVFQRIFGIVCSILKFICTFSTISCGTPQDVLWDAGCEILV
jgi:hypothetical protein